MATVQVNGVTLHYLEAGSPTGIPLVALHGHPGTAATWDDVADELCRTGHSGDSGGYRFLALTQRGYGLSDRVGLYTFEAFAADVLAFADALGLDKFVLLAHSMGATVASLVAAQAPARLLGLILEDSVTPRDGIQLTMPQRPADVDHLPYDWDLVPAIFGQLANPDPNWWRSLSRISAPTLLIAGGSTSHVPQSVLADAAALIPHAMLISLEGAGHTPHRDARARFLAELTKFLTQLTSAD